MPLNYPLIQFSKKQRSIYVERKSERFGICTTKSLKNDFFKDMLIVDSSGLSYKVIGVAGVSPLNSFWKWPSEMLIYSSRLLKADLELSSERSIPLNEVKRLVVEYINLNKDLWGSVTEVESLCENINSAKEYKEIMALVGGNLSE